MQTLEQRQYNTPLNASQVQCNCDQVLNNVETHSVSDIKTCSILSEVNQLRKETQTSKEVLVYVIDMSGKPLMPTTPKSARKLLKEGKATLIKRQLFLIQFRL